MSHVFEHISTPQVFVLDWVRLLESKQWPGLKTGDIPKAETKMVIILKKSLELFLRFDHDFQHCLASITSWKKLWMQKKTFFSMQPNLTTAHDLDLTKTHLAKSDTPLTSVAWTTTKVLKVLSLKKWPSCTISLRPVEWFVVLLSKKHLGILAVVNQVKQHSR